MTVPGVAALHHGPGAMVVKMSRLASTELRNEQVSFREGRHWSGCGFQQLRPETDAEVVSVLEKEITIHSSILAQRVPWTEEPGGL